ncbi:MAG TPA: SDR family oxidoreductase, partial [Chloroflexota bacterium]|nr:SDR family oxidoreductase [Chloroflexota bacterium]
RGHQVIATMRESTGRNQPSRDTLETLATREGLSLQVLDLDVSDEASVEQAVKHALDHYGRLDVVINNAGLAALGITEAFTAEQFHQLFDANVYGPVRVNRAALPHMRRQRSGLLIHISSGAGRVVVPAMAAYNASKFALEALADTYRYELRPFGIESVIVEPGVYRTGIHDKLLGPADTARIAAYGQEGEYAKRVLGTFRAMTSAPDAPGSAEVADALVGLVEMEAGQRPFRTVVSPPIQQLLEPYNTMAEGLRPIVAQIFNVPDLAEPPREPSFSKS